MRRDDDIKSLIRQNDALRAELISASARTELLVSASEEFFGRREMLRARLSNLALSVKIERGLGVVKVSPNLGITIDLDGDKIARSDVTKLGSRILVALARAEEEFDKVARKVLGPPAPDGS